jgi:uncharacterized membrane protein YjjP (DUF1212 family)
VDLSNIARRIAEIRKRREARRWPIVLMWIGAGFFLAGLFSGQTLGFAAGFVSTLAGAIWLWAKQE